MRALFAFIVAVLVTSRALADNRLYKCEIVTPDVETIWLLEDEEAGVFLVSWTCQFGTIVEDWVVSVQTQGGGKVIFEEKAKILDPEPLRRLDWYVKVPWKTDPGEYFIVVMSYKADSMALLNNKVQIRRKDRKIRSSGKAQPKPEEMVSKVIEEKQDQRRSRLRRVNLQDMGEQSRSNLRVMENPTHDEKDEAMKEEKPFILTGLMKQWRCMQRWQFRELSSGVRISRGIDLGVPNLGRVKFSDWNRYRQRYVRENVEDNEYLALKDFFEYYPNFYDDIESADQILGTRNYLSYVDDDVHAGTRFELCPARSGIEWRVNSFNSSQLYLQVVGERRFGLFPKETFFVPGYHHNEYHQRKEVSHPFNYWTNTLPALAKTGQPLYDVILKPGEILYIPSGYWFSTLCLEDSVGTVMDVCHQHNIRECLDELKSQSDGATSNFYGTIFVQMREKLGGDIQAFTPDDFDFVSPLLDEDSTFENLSKKNYMKVREYVKNASSIESIRYEEVLEDIFMPRALDGHESSVDNAIPKDEL